MTNIRALEQAIIRPTLMCEFMHKDEKHACGLMKILISILLIVIIY